MKYALVKSAIGTESEFVDAFGNGCYWGRLKKPPFNSFKETAPDGAYFFLIRGRAARFSLVTATTGGGAIN